MRAIWGSDFNRAAIRTNFNPMVEPNTHNHTLSTTHSLTITTTTHSQPHTYSQPNTHNHTLSTTHSQPPTLNQWAIPHTHTYKHTCMHTYTYTHNTPTPHKTTHNIAPPTQHHTTPHTTPTTSHNTPTSGSFFNFFQHTSLFLSSQLLRGQVVVNVTVVPLFPLQILRALLLHICL